MSGEWLLTLNLWRSEAKVDVSSAAAGAAGVNINRRLAAWAG